MKKFTNKECETCKGYTVITTINYDNNENEYEVDEACPDCNPDMRAYGDRLEDWGGF